jgi:hypothetical protein
MHVAGAFAASAEPWPPTARNAPTNKAARNRRIAARRSFIELRSYACRVTLSRLETRKQREERVTPIELFFDPVFVFAIARVTSIQGEGV